MKVNKEEMIGLLAAMEKYAKLDFAALDREYERQANFLMAELRKAEIKDEMATKARRRMELVQEVHTALQKILAIRHGKR